MTGSGTTAGKAPRRSAVRPVAVAGLSLLGVATSVYLTLYQLRIVHGVWDPFALSGSAWVLRRSPLVRALGFPDALFGVMAYAAELVLHVAAWSSSATAWRRPWRVLLLGMVAASMAAAGLGLTALQWLFGHWCSLCLVSAATSLVIAALVAPEVRGGVDLVVERRRHGARVIEAVTA